MLQNEIQQLVFDLRQAQNWRDFYAQEVERIEKELEIKRELLCEEQ